ncbi:MAG: hypothetical protein ABSC90_02320, partial [Acidimicrobiales bacterium]
MEYSHPRASDQKRPSAIGSVASMLMVSMRSAMVASSGPLGWAAIAGIRASVPYSECLGPAGLFRPFRPFVTPSCDTGSMTAETGVTTKALRSAVEVVGSFV